MMNCREMKACYKSKGFENRHTVRCRGEYTREESRHRIRNEGSAAISHSLMVSLKNACLDLDKTGVKGNKKN